MSDPELDALLQHSRWVRALAQSLARDPGLAEDIVQETWVSVLRRGPKDERSLRGWLATLLRRHLRQVRRGEARRARREECHARELAQPSTADVVERAESQRDLAQAVLDLREPYRTTVLLRYIEELAPDEIAARMDVPLATVHSRLARGLAALRERLEREGKPRPSWAGVLAWLRVGRPRPTLRLLARGVAPGAGLAAGIVALLLGAWIVAGAASEPRPGTTEPAARAALVGAAPHASAIGAGGSREALAVEPRPLGALDPAPRPVRTGRVLDSSGRAVSGVEIALVEAGADGAAQPGGAEHQCTSALDGTFHFPAPTSAAMLRASDARYETVLLCLVLPERETDYAVVVAPKVSLVGRVLTPEGAPLADALLVLHIDPGMAVAYQRALDFSRPERWFALSGADGSFRFASAPTLPEAQLHVSHPGFLDQVVPMPEQSLDALDIVLAHPAADVPTVRGQVLDAAGRPLAGARVSAWPASTTADGAGRFELVLWPPPLTPRIVAVRPGIGATAFEVPTDLEVDPPTYVWPEALVLRLPARAGEVTGRVVNERGQPVAGARVWLGDPTPASVSARGLRYAESLSIDPDTKPWRFVESDVSGAFALAGLLEREYRLCAVDPVTLVLAECQARPGERVELRLPERQAERIAGRVVDARGHALAGVSVRLVRSVLRPELGEHASFNAELSLPRLVTDVDGRFELARASAQGTLLSLESDEILPVILALAELEERQGLRLVASRRTHLRVELSDPARADAFEARDENGRVLSLTQLRGGCSHGHERAPLVAGRSLVLAVVDGVQELVFFRGEDEVRRLPVRIEPGELNLVRW